MIKHLITGGCSFSAGKQYSGWTRELTKKMLATNSSTTYEHTGYFSQGQDLIQKKITLAISDALENNTKPEEILVIVMWSGTSRRAWYIDNEEIIQRMTSGWKKFFGGMSSQFLDLKNVSTTSERHWFETLNGSKFDYNPNGGWYFTVDGSDCPLEFVREFYMLDKNTHGVGKVHGSIENIIMLQNFCRLNKIKLINQFFMDSVYQDIETHKDHQIINYLYKQLDFENMITLGMFEHLHSYIGVDRKDAIRLSHDNRKKLNGDSEYFHEDGFHPGDVGAKIWCDDVLFPFLINKGIL